MDSKPKSTPELVDELVDYINKKIDIPILPESVEALLIKAVLTAIFQFIGAKSN